MQAMVSQYSWLFAVAMFAVSAFVKSQAATLLIMVPIGLVLSLSMNVLIDMMPACYA
jgi:anaerobic C4-dicarboxylate transporter DcuB